MSENCRSTPASSACVASAHAQFALSEASSPCGPRPICTCGAAVAVCTYAVTVSGEPLAGAGSETSPRRHAVMLSTTVSVPTFE